MFEKTWESIVEPEQPLPLSQLELIITEGDLFTLGSRRPAVKTLRAPYHRSKTGGMSGRSLKKQSYPKFSALDDLFQVFHTSDFGCN